MCVCVIIAVFPPISPPPLLYTYGRGGLGVRMCVCVCVIIAGFPPIVFSSFFSSFFPLLYTYGSGGLGVCVCVCVLSLL